MLLVVRYWRVIIVIGVQADARDSVVAKAKVRMHCGD
jgi:hypothetical protein